MYRKYVLVLNSSDQDESIKRKISFKEKDCVAYFINIIKSK